MKKDITEEEYWRGKCFELWKILDDIDTASDMFKENYMSFAGFVYRHQQKRWDVLGEKQVDLLYSMYYDPATDILPNLDD